MKAARLTGPPVICNNRPMSPRIIVSLCILALATGCASTEPTLTIKVDSKPRGVEVFVKNKTRGRLGLPMLVPEWDPVGTTPFTLEWPLASLDVNDPENHQEIPIVLE